MCFDKACIYRIGTTYSLSHFASG